MKCHYSEHSSPPFLLKGQPRDVYVLSVSKLPAFARGYCYGKRIVYVDKHYYGLL
jgi:hypothetical protein